ncbi:MAG: ABC transporter ATP-binding protein [Pelagibacterales bacterium]|nr:ABC transporter ATP-binding protein [Pelagibacterales bacterium]MBT4108719.1 ABC transporter ATP-binding protein [Pelagibacterales bacterium]MBT7077146.1 ABC transporter ATP-binding protein [Pelagibacterales bacterium]MDG2268682.1 ABC transporter ATP-binding protein [Alphaproteobacteria bacterium]
MELLKVQNINAFYGNSQVLFDMNLNITNNNIIALLGRNGAGKSSTFKAINGLISVNSGSILLKGKELIKQSTSKRALSGIGYVPEDRQVFPEHTVEENLDLGKKNSSEGKNNWPIDKVWETFPILAKLKNRMAGQLSGGEQQMLSIARTLVGNPEILLLDEPSEGLAPIIVEDIAAILKNLKKLGVTILLAEQNMHFCLEVAEEAIIIDRGKSVWNGSLKDLQKDTKTRDKYLAI